MTYTFGGVLLQIKTAANMDKVKKIMERWNSLQPLPERDRELLSRRFTIDFNYNSNHIEGQTERGENVWWFDGERVKFRSPSTSNMLNLMYANPDITINALAEQVGINVAAVNKQLKQLYTKGYIQRAQNGEWRMIITPSI